MRASRCANTWGAANPSSKLWSASDFDLRLAMSPSCQIRTALESGPDRRGLDLLGAGGPQEEQLELDGLGGTEGVVFGAHAGEAVAQAAVQRAHALPLQ